MFPRLEQVFVKDIGEFNEWEGTTDQLYSRRHDIHYEITRDTRFQDIFDGKHDTDLVAQASLTVELDTLRNIKPRNERGFQIIYRKIVRFQQHLDPLTEIRVDMVSLES